ncbi:discoidin domain-containing protein [bacterium]|nr:discoidin domain-containing protein [bacterium]MBU1753555.1 discoidin domain-containing protein [bacterium]
MNRLKNRIIWILLIICCIPALSWAEELTIIKTAVTAIGTEHAVLEWETNIETTGQVLYHPVREFQNNLAISIGMATTHSVRLNKLLAGTAYQYQLRVKDADGHTVNSEWAIFTTTGIPLPLFEEIVVGSLTKTTAVVLCRTNVPTKLWVEYGTTTEDRLMVSGPLRDCYQIMLDGLQPDTLYHLRLTAYDNDCHEVISEPCKFTTMEDNIALHATITGTFGECPDDKYVSHDKGFLERITDGDTGYFTGMATSGDVTAGDQFVIIDLGSVQPIDRIRVYWRRLAYSRDYSLLLSNDEENWSVLASGINADDGLDERSDAGDPMKVVMTQGDGKEARFVQVFAAKGSDFFHKHEEWRFVQIMEVKVIKNYELKIKN